MNNYRITEDLMAKFKNYMIKSEKAPATIEKYLRDIGALFDEIGSVELTKEYMVSYKARLRENYKVSSTNSIISSLNSFFKWCGWEHLILKTIKVQREVFRDENRELTKEEYFRLLDEALDQHDLRLWLMIQTICATGIRISELQFITVYAAKMGRADIICKGKKRVIMIPKPLRKQLIEYAKEEHIAKGMIFVTKSGKPLNRSNIWKSLQRLAKAAGVLASKVFPHNLRHLFATVFYQAEKDISKLADVLGHSNINTTRIYIATSGQEHTEILEKMGLIQECSSPLTT